jgi:hypothetical protein
MRVGDVLDLDDTVITSIDADYRLGTWIDPEGTLTEPDASISFQGEPSITQRAGITSGRLGSKETVPLVGAGMTVSLEAKIGTAAGERAEIISQSAHRLKKWEGPARNQYLSGAFGCMSKVFALPCPDPACAGSGVRGLLRQRRR